MYSKFYRSTLFPFYESFLRGRKTLKYLKELERNQWLSEEELREIQWVKLKKLLEHAFLHVPYYKRKFKEIGAHPYDIKIEDFTQFPYLTKDDVQNYKSELVADNYINKNTVHNETSGSTGQPLTFSYPRESYEWRVAAKIRSESSVGLLPGARTALIWGHYISMGLLKQLKMSLYWKSQNVKYLCAYQLDDSNLYKIIKEINHFKPQFIVSYVTPLYYLSRLAIEHQIPLYSPEGIIASAETLYPHQKDLIEKCFHTKVYNRYGCCEFMNIAAECSKRDGMHINIDTLVVEFVREENIQAFEKGLPRGFAPRDDIGEIVVTDLHNYGMPLIRYKLGDLGRPLIKKCSCGRGLPVMDIVQGRVNDVVITPDGKRIPDHLFLWIFAETKGVRKYQIIQKTKETLIIRLVTDNSYAEEEERNILRMIRSVLDDKIELKVEYLNDIPIEKSGKFRYTYSEVVK